MKTQFLTVFLIAIVLFGKCSIALAQNSTGFTLQEAINYALDNNYNVKSAKLDMAVQDKKVKEYIAIGLPQVSSNIKYNYYVSIPTTLMPDFLTKAVVGINQGLFGLTPTQPVTYNEFMPVQFGTKQNGSWDIGLNQLIFNGSFFVGLEANKKLKHLSLQTVRKSETEIKESVAKAYIMVLVSEENKKIVDSTLASLRKILNDTKEFYKSGFVENTDVDQFELLVSNLETTQMTVYKKTELAVKLLKLQMGYPFDAQLTLTDKLESLFNSAMDVPKEGYDFSQSIDYKMMETQRDLAFINLKYEKSKYLPTVNGFFSFSENAMRNDFSFFDFSQKWYPTGIVGLTIGIPIFNSGSKLYRVQQAKYSLDKTKVILEQVKQSLLIQEESARTDYEIAFQTYQNRKKSLNIAQVIYHKTSVKYKEGVSTSFDLSQSYNQYMTTQTDYINSLMQLLNAKQVIEKLYTKGN